jgi:hypothetical protein
MVVPDKYPQWNFMGFGLSLGWGCCHGFLPLDSKFVSIMCQAQMVSTRDNDIYTGLAFGE